MPASGGLGIDCTPHPPIEHGSGNNYWRAKAFIPHIIAHDDRRWLCFCFLPANGGEAISFIVCCRWKRKLLTALLKVLTSLLKAGVEDMLTLIVDSEHSCVLGAFT